MIVLQLEVYQYHAAVPIQGTDIHKDLKQVALAKAKPIAKEEAACVHVFRPTRPLQ